MVTEHEHAQRPEEHSRDFYGTLLPIFGRVFNPWIDASEADQHWRDLLQEETTVHVGAVVFDSCGRVLLVEPKEHYEGYYWTFPKKSCEPGATALDVAIAAVAEKGGLVAPNLIVLLDDAFKGPGNGGKKKPSTNLYYVMLHIGRQDELTSPFVASAQWVTVDDAREFIACSTNHDGRDRDIAVLYSALCQLTYILSTSSMDPKNLGALLDCHHQDWFRLERKLGMEDGSSVTREKLYAESVESVLATNVEPWDWSRPTRLRKIPVPARTFSDQDLAAMRLGIVDDRGIVFVEDDEEADLRVCIYRSRSGLCAYEAQLSHGLLGWRIAEVGLNEQIYNPEYPKGSDAWEAVLFEHILVNLFLKKLDEALWRRFFAADPSLHHY